MSSRHGNTGSKFAQSNVRDITRRREKPFRTEQAVLLSKKGKLKTQVSYTAAPAGYIFVPLGTPELAELCKEISKQRGFSVNIVNAKPANKTVMDPGKISHHIQRIGYHFRNEAVEQATTQLGYILYGGQFMTAEELSQRTSQSVIAMTMAKYGLHPTADQQAIKETPEKVSAAIKELFPSIPEKDLHEIVHHAWAEGSDRVGTATDVDLSRRVQLAVIARIRHNYTDYDRLLKAFDWQYARREIESDCLKKLIEWRGEQEDDEDNGLQEIVQTIVLDDDDAPRLRHGAFRRDFTPGTGPGDMSDTSIEIVHRPAVGDDLRAEAPHEQQHRYLQPRGQMRNDAERSNFARAKLDAVRGQMRAEQSRSLVPPPAEIVTRININGGDGSAPNEIIVDGVVMKRAPPQDHPGPMQQRHVSMPMPPMAFTQQQQGHPGLQLNSSVPQVQQQRYSAPQPPPPMSYAQQQQQQHPGVQPLSPTSYAQQQQYPVVQPLPLVPQTYSQPSVRRQDIPVPSIEPNHRSASIMASSPRHGQPALLQYIHTNSGRPLPPQQRSFPAAAPIPPPKPLQAFQPQHTLTTVPIPPMPPHIPYGGPLPPIPSAQPSSQFYAPNHPQPMLFSQQLPQYAQVQHFSRPVHGAPAPVQPASSNATPQPYQQHWYGR